MTESFKKTRLPRWAWISGLVILLTIQAGFGLQGIDNYWQWGHNGYNGAAYLLGAKNSLRWEMLFPAQYASGNHKPTPGELYTHAPLMLHLHNVASVTLFGDRELSIRLVPMLYGLLAIAVLFGFVKRRWGDLHAIAVCAIYVVLPINQGFANMTNHDTGCIAWSLLMIACYLEWLEAGDAPGRKWAWAVGIFVSCFFAVNWNWPAYYIAFILAFHWLYASYDTAHRPLPARLGLNREHGLLAGFCVFVLANFFGFFLLVYTLVGGFDELKRSFNQRSTSTTDIYSRIWNESLEPMFGSALIALGVLWLVGLIIRHARHEARPADLAPLAFAFAGTLHILLFKQTVVVHIYWPWQLNPFLAMAAGIVLVSAAQALYRGAVGLHRGEQMPTWGRRAVGALAALVVFVPFGSTYLAHTLPRIPEARQLAGTYNFKNYDGEYLKILFARELRGWTELETGVLIMRHIKHRVEFVATMDRIRGWTLRPDRISPPKLKEATGGWVVIGEVRKTPRSQILKAAKEHPYRQYGLYFMVDHRVEGQDIQIYNLEPAPMSAWWWFFVNPYDPPMEAIRDEAAEARLKDEIARVKPPKTRAPRTPKKPVMGPVNKPSDKGPVLPGAKKPKTKLKKTRSQSPPRRERPSAPRRP